jgi:hypothetical protein
VDSLSFNGWGAISACGVCYSTDENPDLSDQNSQTIAQSGEFSTLLKGLQDNTAYYYRAYATNIAGTTYGQQLSFTTALGILKTCASLWQVQFYFWSGMPWIVPIAIAYSAVAIPMQKTGARLLPLQQIPTGQIQNPLPAIFTGLLLRLNP